MKGLSLIQPWASLIALGAKTVETRSWNTSYRGLLAIHASKSLPKNWQPFSAPEFVKVLEPIVGVNEYGAPNLDRLPRGAVVAVARLMAVVPTSEVAVEAYLDGATWALSGRTRDPFGGLKIGTREAALGDFTPGRFAWLLDEVRKLPEPVPCIGMLGLWPLSEALAEKIG